MTAPQHSALEQTLSSTKHAVRYSTIRMFFEKNILNRSKCFCSSDPGDDCGPVEQPRLGLPRGEPGLRRRRRRRHRPRQRVRPVRLREQVRGRRRLCARSFQRGEQDLLHADKVLGAVHCRGVRRQDGTLQILL